MKKTLFIFPIGAFLFWAGCSPNVNRQLTEFDEFGCWSAVGSAGTIDGATDSYVLGSPLRTFILPDEDPLAFRFLNLSLDGVASIRPAIESANASIRYDIGFLLENKSQFKELSVRYLVTDKSKQRLLVILKKYARQPSQTPATEEKSEVVKIFDSNQFPASPTFQTQSVVLPRNDAIGTFDFSNFAYYIEALLVRNGLEQKIPTTGTGLGIHTAPALGIVSICDQVIILKR